MPITDAPTRSRKELLTQLASARDEARLQLHLLSMDSRAHWQELERKIDAFERTLNEGGEKASEAIAETVHRLTKAARDFIASQRPARAALSSPVSSIMSTTVHTCAPYELLNIAAQFLWEQNFGSLPVVAVDGTLVGMITDRDICMASYTQGKSLTESTVESAMSRTVHSCSPEDSIERALEIMSRNQVHRVPVVESGRLVGIVALADIARWVQSLRSGRELACDALAKALSAISQPPAGVEQEAAAAQ
jgi:CBS domain-containing protein